MSNLTGDWNKLANMLNPSRLKNSLRKCAAKAGNYGASEVKKGIRGGAPGGQSFAPLSPVTIINKGSSKPLIDHGDLIGSVTYEVFNDNSSVFIGVKKGKEVNIAAVHEYGCTIEVTSEMRAYLHYHGIHLKKITAYIHIPARPFLSPVFQSVEFQKMISEIYLNALREGFSL